ncbi:MAG: ceramidase domain-containing protein [Verrucomicrobia bacterium]|nr:ceramidase domain-containing protein [Verrucomicrobiota bacterium]
MSRGSWLRATAFTFSLALAVALAVSFATGRFAWGPPEFPKAQCEALTAASVSPAVKNALTVVYQERVAAAIIREPQDTWSNLAFVFVGALIWVHDRRVFARLFAAALVGLGIGSGLYHASLLPSWRSLDVATMGWVSFALCCHGYVAGSGTLPDAEQKRTRVRDLAIGFIGGALAMTAAFFRNDVRIAGVKPFDSTYTTILGIAAVFALAVVGLLRAVKARPGLRLPLARVGLLVAVVGAAVFCQLNDRVGRCFCAPESPVQAHAVWHVLMAAATALAYDVFAFVEGRPGMLSPGTAQ